MKIGFTGTKEGTTKKQQEVIEKIILKSQPTEFHHGSCVGADDEIGKLVKLAIPLCQIILHPPTDTKLKANSYYDITREAKPYLDRNKDIVNESELMLATPKEKVEQLRSGTWSTIRYAKKRGRSLIIVYPDGSHEYFEDTLSFV